MDYESINRREALNLQDRPVELKFINLRVDQALNSNRRAEQLILVMAVLIFLLGISIVGLAYWQRNPYVGGGTLVLQGFFYFPIKEVLKLRRDNLILQTLPVLISGLSARAAAKEVQKALAHLRGRLP